MTMDNECKLDNYPHEPCIYEYDDCGKSYCRLVTEAYDECDGHFPYISIKQCAIMQGLKVDEDWL